MTLLLISVAIVLVVSALCSLAEASVYAVSPAYVRQQDEGGKLSGRILSGFKDNMERPITAILIVNTIANTAGAAVAGSQARVILGEGSVFWFSAAFTVGVLFVSEIIPKVIGVTYSRAVSTALAAPLWLGVLLLQPIVWLTQRLTKLIQPAESAAVAPEIEVEQFAALSAQEGSILPSEAALVQNALRLDDVTAQEIMTPRSVVISLRDDRTVAEVAEQAPGWAHSRLPIYSADSGERWVGMVLQRDILACLARDEFDTTLSDLSKPLSFVPTTRRAHELLAEFLRRRTHLLGVLDEFGSVVGVVTLEDVTESLIGAEIVDESDAEVDLQELARRRAERLKPSTSPDDDEKRDDPKTQE